MLPMVNNIQEAIPIFVKALVTDNVLAVNGLLEKFPKLILLKDKRNRNILMMAIYGPPLPFVTGQENLPTVRFYNQTVISYLISFYVIASPKINLNDEDDDGLNAYDWAVLSGNEFAISLMNKLKVADEDNELEG